jgi:hypothetical protein
MRAASKIDPNELRVRASFPGFCWKRACALLAAFDLTGEALDWVVYNRFFGHCQPCRAALVQFSTLIKFN